MADRAFDKKMMARALDLAARGKGKTAPNPMVGAVVVKEGRVVGEGYHRRAGSAHAEVVALGTAGKKGKGAVLYVSLEPCCHSSKTGPCVKKIAEAGIREVVYSVNDPNPLVNGKGARWLRRAGIAVRSGVLREESESLNEVFFTVQRTGRPFVTVKTAQSLDGRVATADGNSKWITGGQARTYAHKLRSEVDAIIVGSGTVRKDNPSLTVRRTRGKNPQRMVLSSSLDISPQSRLFNDGNGHVVIYSTAKVIREKSGRFGKCDVSFVAIPRERSFRLDLKMFLDRCAESGVQSVLVEGGPTLATSFIRQGLADKVIVITAPVMIGEGINSLGDLGIGKIAQSIQCTKSSFSNLGRDCLFVGYPEKRRV